MRKSHASQYANFGSLLKFSTKAWEKSMLVNTPILAYWTFTGCVIYFSKGSSNAEVLAHNDKVKEILNTLPYYILK